MYLKLHRYLIRQYLYPLLAFLFLLLLIKWNSLQKPGTTGSQFHDQDFLNEFSPQTMVISRPITSEDMSLLLKEPAKEAVEEKKVDETEIPTKSASSSEKDLPDTTNAKAIKPTKKGNVVDLTVFMEAQCPDTTGFVKRQLVPAWEKLHLTRRVNVTVVPFGKAHCVRKEQDDFACECQHGVEECDLNVLMNCAMDRLAGPDQYMSMLGCIQGKTDLQTAFQTCVAGHTQADWLWKCAHNKHGRYLHFLAGEKTEKLGTDFNFVPWVVLDGQRVNDAFYALSENLCNRLDPKPIQCENFI